MQTRLLPLLSSSLASPAAVAALASIGFIIVLLIQGCLQMPMKTRLLLVLAAALALSTWIFWRFASTSELDPKFGVLVWIKVYRESLRTPLFSGFFTLGGFLLTLKSTILMRIKEIYETDDYATNWKLLKEQREREGTRNSELEYYGPLRNLGTALMANVVLSLVSSLLQMTLGFVDSPLAVAICLGFAFTAIGLVIFLAVQISANLAVWFETIESEKKRKLESQHSKSSPGSQ